MLMDFAIAGLMAVFVWWFSTGVVFLLDALPRSTFRWSAAGASLVALAGVWGIWATSRDASSAGVIWAFLSAIAIWGWHELAFLRGYVTGPRKAHCVPGTKGWRRFKQAANTVIWHELALAATGLLLLALAWNAPNQFGVWTFALLWAMRLSAKLNLFLGVPNFSLELFPERLSHMRSFTAKKPMNVLFPVSVTLGTAGSVLLAHAALTAGPDPMSALGFALLATLLALAVLEHWFLVLPLPDEALWAWARRPEGWAGSAGRTAADERVKETDQGPATLPLERTRGTNRGRGIDRAPVFSPTPLSGSVDH